MRGFTAMAVKLHRCTVQWSKHRRHPCRLVEKALIDAGIEYERVVSPKPGGGLSGALSLKFSRFGSTSCSLR